MHTVSPVFSGRTHRTDSACSCTEQGPGTVHRGVKQLIRAGETCRRLQSLPDVCGLCLTPLGTRVKCQLLFRNLTLELQKEKRCVLVDIFAKWEVYLKLVSTQASIHYCSVPEFSLPERKQIFTCFGFINSLDMVNHPYPLGNKDSEILFVGIGQEPTL